MAKSQDITTIICVVVIILFAILTTVYFINNNNIQDNSSIKDSISNIYTEHPHNTKTNESNNLVTIKKTYEKISSYTTEIYDDDKNRVYNIKLACKRLDGHIVRAGEEFSFNNKMGKMGEAEGYKKALGFDSYGNKIKVFGGGLCQISSTLYNSVLIADLKVTERHAHSRRVYYVPKNKDATIFYGGPDFKFINNTDSNIMICATTDGYSVTVTLKQEKIAET